MLALTTQHVDLQHRWRTRTADPLLAMEAWRQQVATHGNGSRLSEPVSGLGSSESLDEHSCSWLVDLGGNSGEVYQRSTRLPSQVIVSHLLSCRPGAGSDLRWLLLTPGDGSP